VREEMNERANNRSPCKKLACVETSNAMQAKIKIKTASIYRNGTGLFFILLLCIFEMWLAEGSPPSLLLAQALWLRSQGFFLLSGYTELCGLYSIINIL
jgi:hypothetical protein